MRLADVLASARSVSVRDRCGALHGASASPSARCSWPRSISASSRADLVAQLDRLGTNRLEVRPGQSFTGTDAQLPETSVAMVRRIGPVIEAGVAAVTATVRRSDLVPEAETNGIGVLATDASLLAAVDGTVRDGRFLDDAVDGYPAIVLARQPRSASASRTSRPDHGSS